ncbi:MAG: AmmeMemoRadiSam system protein B [Nanoarchaeota archaeon]
MRKAVVAGQFYPENVEELKSMIDGFFSDLQVSSISDKPIRAGIAPHAGYVFSGKCAAFLYKLLKNQNFDTFIILGTNHSGMGENICFSISDFETPLGIVENDMNLTEDLLIQIKKLNVKSGVSEEAHKYEHSIEVQLPFLQQTSKNFKIVPILFKDLSIKDIESLGKIFSSIIKQEEKKGKKVFVLASSDFTHYGKNFKFVPFTDNIKENLYKLDNEAIDSILALDVEAFYGKSRITTICGGNSVSLCVQIAKNLGLTAEKLCYYTSGDVLGKWDSAVGYASIGFY